MSEIFQLYGSTGRVRLLGLATWLSHGYILSPGAKPKNNEKGQPVLYSTRDVIKDEEKAAAALKILQEERRQQRNQRAKERRLKEKDRKLREKQRQDELAKAERKRCKSFRAQSKKQWSDFLSQNKVLFITINTTGFDYKNDQVTSIALSLCHFFDGSVRVIDEMQLDLKRDERGSLDKECERRLSALFLWSLKKKPVIIGHNVTFITEFLSNLFLELKWKYEIGYLYRCSTICTMSDDYSIIADNDSYIYKPSKWLSLVELSNIADSTKADMDQESCMSRINVLHNIISCAVNTGFMSFISPSVDIRIPKEEYWRR